MAETLGVLAHRGGLVVERPELSVGVVRAVARGDGLEVELLARRPLDRRSALERQADIRAGRGGAGPAPRRLLPAYDEGVDLRVGWLDGGRARWAFGSWSSSSGDHFEGVDGPSLRTVLRFPPLFDRVALVLAWPEIGFPETVVELPLPSRATVERETVSIWDAPVRTRPVPDPLHRRAGAERFDRLRVETGRIVAGPRVLHRGDGAVVVLNRVTAVGDALSMEILSVAERDLPLDEGAAVAVVHGGEAIPAEPLGGSSSGGPGLRCTMEFAAQRPAGDDLVLLVGWPAAGLAEVRVDVSF